MARVLTIVRKRPVAVALQLAALAALLLFLAWAVRDVWPEARPRIRHADPVDLAAGLAALAGYYLVFVVGWLWILRAYGIRVGYVAALQSEMVSMLAKYIPGGVWTPASRVVALRRFTQADAAVVLATILLEAGLSAIAGVFVFFAGLPLVAGAEAPLLPLVAFTAAVLVALHPRVFRPLARRLLRPFGASDIGTLAPRTVVGLVAFYAATWPLGGLALFFLLRAVGGDPDIAAIPFLGGASAIGAIVAVLVVFAPSGLGVREASMYGLVLAVAGEGAALGATILNRLAITVVEAALLVLGAALWALGRGRRRAASPDGPAADAPAGVVESRP